jgi:hypothetical protein
MPEDHAGHNHLHQSSEFSILATVELAMFQNSVKPVTGEEVGPRFLVRVVLGSASVEPGKLSGEVLS